MISDLILFRLFVAPAEGETLANVKKDLQIFSESAFATQEFQRLFDNLTAQGLIMRQTGKRRHNLTQEGQRVVRDRLHLGDASPKATRWVDLRDRYVTALALGISGETSSQDQLSSAAGLRAAILKKHYAPELRNAPTQSEVVNHLVVKAVGARRATPVEFRKALIKSWLASKASNEPEEAAAMPAEVPSSKSLPEFAREVQEVATQTRSGRFGDNKVFISHVWREIKTRGLAGLASDLERFKARLVEANTGGLLRLSRADLTSAFSREDIADSEISDLLSSFHFIQI